MFSYSGKCAANFPSKTQHEQKNKHPAGSNHLPSPYKSGAPYKTAADGWRQAGALSRRTVALLSQTLYSTLPASHQAEPQTEKESRRKKKKKWGSISRPLAFCLNSSSLRLSISLSLPSIYIKDGGERRGGSQAQQKGEMQSNRQVMNRARGGA